MATTHTDFGGVVNAEALERFILAIEALDEERAGHNEKRREVYDRAKQAGFVPAILRQVVAERKLEPEVRVDLYALLDAYRRALGMLADTPLGEAAMRRETAAATRLPDPPRAEWPAPFAEQPVHNPTRRRGRPRKTSQEALAAARAHLEAELAGTA